TMKSSIIHAMVTGLLVLATARMSSAAELKILLPLGRTAYQTNEWIHLSVSRTADTALSVGELDLKVSGEDGSQLSFTFRAATAEAQGGKAHRIDHLHLNGWLLRPGKYTVEAACDGASARTAIEVFSHVRRSTFRLVNWGARAAGTARLPEGEDNLG